MARGAGHGPDLIQGWLDAVYYFDYTGYVADPKANSYIHIATYASSHVMLSMVSIGQEFSILEHLVPLSTFCKHHHTD